MKLEHVGMPQPGDCRVVFSASAEELEAAVLAVQAGANPPADEEDRMTEAVNQAILSGFSTLYEEIVEKNGLVPVTDPDFELLAVNRAEGFRAGAEFYCLPPLELERYTGFVQQITPRPIRRLSIELEINRSMGTRTAPPTRRARQRCAGRWPGRSMPSAASRQSSWPGGSWSISWAAA